MSRRYVVPRPDGKECASCHYPAQTLTEYPSRTKNDRTNLLCEICAGTEVGTDFEFPDKQNAILQTIAFIGNAILDQFYERRTK